MTRVMILMAIASPWSRAVAEELQATGLEVDVVDFSTPPSAAAYLSAADAEQQAGIVALRERVSGVHLLRTSRSSRLRFLEGVPELRRLRQRRGHDVLLTLYGGGFAAMAMLSGIRPYVVYVVGSDVLMAGGAARVIARRALERAALVLANGRHLAARTRQLAPLARVIPHYLGVDTRRFSAGAPRLRAHEPVRIVCTRGFLPVYNNSYLIDALAALTPPHPPIHVTFASRGPLLAEAEAHAARQLAATGPDIEVEFLRGTDDDTLRDLVSSADVYVSVSRSDGTSISLLEALASGAFPILSDIPANREWIDEGAENGILVPLDQPEVLAAALRTAIESPGRRERAAVVNRRAVCMRADSDGNIRALARHLIDVADGTLVEHT